MVNNRNDSMDKIVQRKVNNIVTLLKMMLLKLLDENATFHKYFPHSYVLESWCAIQADTTVIKIVK